MSELDDKFTVNWYRERCDAMADYIGELQSELLASHDLLSRCNAENEKIYDRVCAERDELQKRLDSINQT